MILCEEPYTNEPGWQNDAGSPNSKACKQVILSQFLLIQLWLDSANVRRMVVNTAVS